MPIYEYICSECLHEWESIQKVSHKPLDTCPACDKKAAKRLISSCSFHLKGTGWHNTDYSKSGPKYGSAATKRLVNDSVIDSDESLKKMRNKRVNKKKLIN